MCPGWFSGDCNDDESCCNTKYYYIKGQRVVPLFELTDTESSNSLDKEGWILDDDDDIMNRRFSVHIVPVILDPSQDSLEKQQYYQDLHNVKMSMSRPNTPVNRPNTPVNRFR